jgi:CHAD domain-containing protein
VVQAQDEREEKFEVEQDWVMPDVGGFVPDGGTVSDELRNLRNSYFDTPDLRLLDLGVTLRRRIGGGETGWQLKVPTGSARTELHNGSNRRTLPDDMSEAVAGLTGGQKLVPVATISTIRTARRVLDAENNVVFELADDAVKSTAHDSDSSLEWREIEVELGPAAQKKTQAKVAAWLLNAGAKPSSSTTKLHRALGIAAADTRSRSDRNGTIGALVLDYLAEQCEVIACNDVGLRTGAPLVHKTRVAVRRLRSTLRIFGDMFEPEQSSALDAELVWYASLLGAVRDCEVLAARLADRIAQLPPEQVYGPVSAHVQESLALDRKQAADKLARGMSSRRYKKLLATLRVWRTDPPLNEAADRKAAAAARYVQQAKRKAQKRLKQAHGDNEGLHRARKAMKRLRYAGELAKPADQKASRVVRKAKHLQTELGEHQDAMVSAGYLARLGAAAGSSNGHNGFTYGVLMANELATAERIRRAYRAQ